MGKWEKGRSYLAPALSGLMMVAAFAPLGWGWCGWVALTPAWFVLRTDDAVGRRPFRHGLLLGLIFIGGCFWWIGAATPLGLGVMLVVLSCYPALWLLLMARLGPASRDMASSGQLLLRVLVASAFWVTLEWMRSWFLSGFNWNELGVSQTGSMHFRQLAALGGVPLLSFVLAACSILLAETLVAMRLPLQVRFRPAVVPALLAAILVTATWLFGWLHLQRQENGSGATRSLSYVCIQPNIPEIPYATAPMTEIAPREVDAFRVEEELSASAIQDQPDLLIWPEAITTQRLMLDPLIGGSVEKVMARFHGDFLLGAEELSGNALYNCAYLLDPRARSLQDYRKIHLVILGEYLPWSDRFPWLNKLWGNGISFRRGDQPASFAMAREGIHFAPLICFEDTQPQTAENAARLHPDFFVTLTNDSWYEGIRAHWMQTQHLQNALLRCVEHDCPLVRCGNTGISCEVDSSGSVVERVENDNGDFVGVQGRLSRRLILGPHQTTLYERLGDWVGMVCRIISLAAGGAYLLRNTPFRQAG